MNARHAANTGRLPLSLLDRLRSAAHGQYLSAKLAYTDRRIRQLQSDTARTLMMVTLLDFDGGHSRALDLRYAEQRQRLALLQRARACTNSRLMLLQAWGRL